MSTKAKPYLGLSKMTPEAKVVKTQSVLDSMQSSGHFPDASMPMSYAAVQTLIDNLHTATIAANNGSSEDVSNMHESEKVLVMAYNLIKAHVEITCNNFPNPEAIILSAGMTVSGQGGNSAITDLTLEATGGGTILIRVPRTTKDKAFRYQYATDADPTNWQDIGFYSVSKIELKNQVPGTNLLVRYAPIGSLGLGIYSDSKQLMVV
jgi:hypothetical protein